MREMIRNSTFPWLTVCNQSPFSLDSPYSWADFFDTMETFREILQLTPLVNDYAFGVSMSLAETYLTWYESQFGYVAKSQYNGVTDG